jgi:cell division protein FtsB
MVVRKRARRILIPLALYSVSAAAVGYFVHHAHSGSRGLEAKRQLKIQVYEIGQQLDGVKAERAEWERRIALLRSDQIDRDLLEERARALLGRVHRNDLVIITGSEANGPADPR